MWASESYFGWVGDGGKVEVWALWCPMEKTEQVEVSWWPARVTEGRKWEVANYSSSNSPCKLLWAHDERVRHHEFISLPTAPTLIMSSASGSRGCEASQGPNTVICIWFYRKGTNVKIFVHFVIFFNTERRKGKRHTMIPHHGNIGWEASLDRYEMDIEYLISHDTYFEF